MNYDVNANTDNGNCCYVGGCMIQVFLIMMRSACYDNGTCIPVVEGCTDIGISIMMQQQTQMMVHVFHSSMVVQMTQCLTMILRQHR